MKEFDTKPIAEKVKLGVSLLKNDLEKIIDVNLDLYYSMRESIPAELNFQICLDKQSFRNELIKLFNRYIETLNDDSSLLSEEDQYKILIIESFFTNIVEYTRLNFLLDNERSGLTNAIS